MKKIIIFALLLLIPFLSACNLIGSFMASGCDMMGDEKAHCLQGAAIQSGDETKCDKIPVAKKFEGMGSNPPKDKCYLIVAQNTDKLSACKKIQGGLMSYSQEECAAPVVDKMLVAVNSKLQDKDLTEQELLEVQAKMNEMQKVNELMTNMQKMQFETSKAIVSNIRG